MSGGDDSLWHWIVWLPVSLYFMYLGVSDYFAYGGVTINVVYAFTGALMFPPTNIMMLALFDWKLSGRLKILLFYEAIIAVVLLSFFIPSTESVKLW